MLDPKFSSSRVNIMAIAWGVSDIRSSRNARRPWFDPTRIYDDAISEDKGRSNSLLTDREKLNEVEEFEDGLYSL